MKRNDYKCLNCNHIWEIWISNNLEDFPKNPECPNCKSTNTKRKYEKITFDIAEGIAGNSENGYSHGFVNHSSKFGKMKGKRIK